MSQCYPKRARKSPYSDKHETVQTSAEGIRIFMTKTQNTELGESVVIRLSHHQKYYAKYILKTGL